MIIRQWLTILGHPVYKMRSVIKAIISEIRTTYMPSEIMRITVITSDSPFGITFREISKIDFTDIHTSVIPVCRLSLIVGL